MSRRSALLAPRIAAVAGVVIACGFLAILVWGMEYFLLPIAEREFNLGKYLERFNAAIATGYRLLQDIIGLCYSALT